MPSREPDILRPDANRLMAVLLGVVLLLGLRFDAELLCHAYDEAGVVAKIVGFPKSPPARASNPQYRKSLIVRPPDQPSFALVGDQAHSAGAHGSSMPAHAVAWVYEMSRPSGVGLWHAEYRVRDGDIVIEPLGAHTIDEARARLYLSLADRARIRYWFAPEYADTIANLNVRDQLRQGWFRHAQGATPTISRASVVYDMHLGQISWPRVLHSTIALGVMVGAVLCFLYALPRPLFRRPPGQCQACGYNREGLTSQPCPECGAAASSAAVKDPSPS
ncbi:MAG: hypothetical protein AAF138_10205 [Planctomycetota bacterium]